MDPIEPREGPFLFVSHDTFWCDDDFNTVMAKTAELSGYTLANRWFEKSRHLVDPCSGLAVCGIAVDTLRRDVRMLCLDCCVQALFAPRRSLINELLEVELVVEEERANRYRLSR